MARALIVLGLVAALATAASAAPLVIGIRGGASVPELRDNGGNEISSGWSTRLAPQFGVFADHDVNGLLSIQLEANLAPQGGRKDGMQPAPVDPTQLGAPPGTALYANFKNVAKLDYLEIPLLANLHFGADRSLSVRAGPYVGFLMSAKTETSGSSPIFLDKQGTQQAAPAQDFDATTDDKSDLNSINWGFQAGAGASRRMGRGRVSLDVRASLGLANIQKNTAADGKNTTGDLLVTLGYGLPIGAR